MLNLFSKITDMLTATALAEMGLFKAAEDILKEYEQQKDSASLALPDECQYGDNDACFFQV
jgi:hypothetical protein